MKKNKTKQNKTKQRKANLDGFTVRFYQTVKETISILRKISKKSRRVYFLTILYGQHIHDISDKGF